MVFLGCLLMIIPFPSCRQLQPCAGEVIIDYLAHVEDTKGNNGDKGSYYQGIIPQAQLTRSGTASDVLCISFVMVIRNFDCWSATLLLDYSMETRLMS